MIDGVDIYFNIGGFTYRQNSEEISQAISFIKSLEELGFEDGGTTEEMCLVGCREHKKYGINIWENFSQMRITKNELEKIASKEKVQ